MSEDVKKINNEEDEKNKKYEEQLKNMAEGNIENFVGLLESADKEVIEKLGLTDKMYEVLILFGEYQLAFEDGTFIVETSNIYDNKVKKKKKVAKEEAKQLFVQWMISRSLGVKKETNVQTKAPKVKNIEREVQTKKKEIIETQPRTKKIIKEDMSR